MNDFIKAVNGRLPQPYLVLPKKWLDEILDWLQAKGIGYKVTEGSEAASDLCLVDVDPPPNGIEPIMDAWIEARGLAHEKWYHPAISRLPANDPRDPFQILWKIQRVP
jgi:hypothetical protein